ncbi:uncharacterized protein LOC103843891 [Brassica rapa]|uniref:uncharacterized protein LOC103843891 n=1 Tax=Brassica campestris TaxID=3711 RepID=UPI00142DFF66|nr:uncharacterized protein LOC103843891 [Brassica rapa]
MSSRIHQATSVVPEIDSVIASTSRTPFTEELTEVKLRKMDNLRLPEYKPGGDPVEHLTAFNIAVAKARLAPKERDAGYCQLFVETLNEQALTWFSGFEENSISSFKQLSLAFLKTYIMFTKRSNSLEPLEPQANEGPEPSRLHGTIQLQDAVARSHNFIRMEEDTKAIMSKHNSVKQSVPKSAATAHIEPRQHAPSDKNNRKNGLLYFVDENGKKWNTFHRETYPPSESPRATATAAVAQVDSAAGSSRTPPGLTKSCKLHGVKGHDTSECKTLFAQFLSSLESGELKIPPPKPKSENSWSRNKDRKNQRKNQAVEDQPAVRQRIEVIRTQPEPSSDEESGLEEALDPLDLLTFLKRMITPTNNETPGPSDLRVELNAKRTKHALSQGSPPASTGDNTIVDLRDQLNARMDDLHLLGINFPHNDPLLVVLAIDKYDVTKVLIDTGSSVDIIFRETLVKKGIDLKDVKPSSRTLTGFNGSSEVILGTIRLSVQAEGVTRMVKFSEVSTKAPYHVILGTPWLYSMRAIVSTYHQCVKFPGVDGTVKTVRGDQRAARDLLIATVKLQRSQSLVNLISPPISKVCPQKEEVLEVPVDESDPTKYYE